MKIDHSMTVEFLVLLAGHNVVGMDHSMAVVMFILESILMCGLGVKVNSALCVQCGK